jgi:hypothetical protein
VPVFQTAVYTAGTDSTLLTYSLNFSASAGGTPETLVSGNFVTLYDVYNPAMTTFSFNSSVPVGVIASTTAGTGVTPALVTPTDNPAFNNITFTYTDGTSTTDLTITVAFTLSGNFAGPTRIGQYTSIDNIPLGTNNQIGPVVLPTPIAVPEPGSVILMGLGLLGVAGVSRRRFA